MQMLKSAILATLVLTACANKPPPRPMQAPVFTPIGELLAAAAPPEACHPQLEAWFDRADTDRSGSLSRTEFEAEARRVFPTLDADGDGLVTSRELSARRGRLGPPREAGLERGAEERPGPPRGGSRPPGGMRRERADDFGSADGPRRARGPESGEGAPDPVMAADTNLDFRVSLDEFVIHAGRRFDLLDRGRRGQIDRSAVAATCEGGRVSPPG